MIAGEDAGGDPNFQQNESQVKLPATVPRSLQSQDFKERFHAGCNSELGGKCGKFQLIRDLMNQTVTYFLAYDTGKQKDTVFRIGSF